MNPFITAIPSIIGGLAVALITWLIRVIRKHDQTHDDTNVRLQKIEAEFRPNGGNSQRDLQEAMYATMRQLAQKNGLKPLPHPSKRKRHP